MKNQPTPRAWEDDPFWKEVVNVLTGGRKLRPEHYLDKLSAEDLEQLRSALSFSGTFAEQQKLCPPRRGGPSDGSLPDITMLSDIATAIRQVNVLRELNAQRLIEKAATARCNELGLDQSLTNAVVRVVGEEALDHKVKNKLGNFAISAANVLLMAEGMRTKGKQEEIKIELRQRAEARQASKLKLEREKFERDYCQKLLDKATREAVERIAGSPMSNAEKIAAMRKEVFKSVDELEASGTVEIPKL